MQWTMKVSVKLCIFVTFSAGMCTEASSNLPSCHLDGDQTSFMQLRTEVRIAGSLNSSKSKEYSDSMSRDLMNPQASDHVQDGSHVMPNFEKLKSSVVRIQVVQLEFDWREPYKTDVAGQSIGSGFVVQTKPYPLFVTNAHVVSDGQEITLQVLAHSVQQWRATVVSICEKFDIALLVLQDPVTFTASMEKKNLELIPLDFATQPPPIGSHVTAAGFPLGQTSLKIAEGNIAGNEVVFNYISLASTAPISPGNSGGPLLNAEGSVLGINFAADESGENMAYVVPSWRVVQMINLHQEEREKKDFSFFTNEMEKPTLVQKEKENETEKTMSRWQRRQVHIPDPDLVSIQPDLALFSISGGCNRGVFIPKLGNWSYFTGADPPMPWQSFLVSVNGIELDQFGMGSNPKYASDLVHFTDLVWMKDFLSTNFSFTTCKEGTETKHTASVSWRPQFTQGISLVEEPTFANIEYEVFGDLTIMEMTYNHVEYFVLQKKNEVLAHWVHPDVTYSPRLIVSATQPGSYAEQILGNFGSVVEKVNGVAVRTLKDYRKHFIPAASQEKPAVWTLETDLGEVYAVNFMNVLKLQIGLALQEFDTSKLTTAVVAAGEELKLSTVLDFNKVVGLLDKPLARKPRLTKKDIKAAGPMLVSKEGRGYVGQVSHRLRKLQIGQKTSCN